MVLSNRQGMTASWFFSVSFLIESLFLLLLIFFFFFFLFCIWAGWLHLGSIVQGLFSFLICANLFKLNVQHLARFKCCKMIVNTIIVLNVFVVFKNTIVGWKVNVIRLMLKYSIFIMDYTSNNVYCFAARM